MVGRSEAPGSRAEPPEGPGGAAPTGPPAPLRTPNAGRASRGTLARLGYLLVPLLGVWFVVAYVLPSPVGVVLPAVPYLALGLAGAAVILAYALARGAKGQRWSSAYRTAVVAGTAAGLVAAGLAGLAGSLVLGCPVLPPASDLHPAQEGWSTVSAPAWKEGGVPVLFFFGATWCPYCSASSWAVWKALTEFGTVSGVTTGYSYGPPEVDPYTPEVDLAGAQLSSRTVALEVREYDGGVDGEAPTTSNCVQQAYVSTYDACADCGIPFLVVGGQYLHTGSLYDPGSLSAWSETKDPGGAAFVEGSVLSESGAPWQVVQGQAWWIMAYLAYVSGRSVPSLASEYGWSPTTTASVWDDVNLTS